MDESNDPIDRGEYLDHRKSLISLGNEQLAAFDKTLILVATGAIGASALLLRALFPETLPSQLWLLLMSWTAFVLTILLNLASHLSSWHDMQIELTNFDKNYAENTPDTQHSNWARPATMALNYLSLVAFVVGVIVLFAFAGSAFTEVQNDRETTTENARPDRDEWSSFLTAPETDAAGAGRPEANDGQQIRVNPL